MRIRIGTLYSHYLRIQQNTSIPENVLFQFFSEILHGLSYEFNFIRGFHNRMYKKTCKSCIGVTDRLANPLSNIVFLECS